MTRDQENIMIGKYLKIISKERLSVFATTLYVYLLERWREWYKKGEWDGWFYTSDDEMNLPMCRETRRKSRRELEDHGLIKCKRGYAGRRIGQRKTGYKLLVKE